MCHRQRYWVTRNMDKPSKGKYAITNRTRQLLTVSFVALGSFLVFSGSKCNDTTKLTYVIVELGPGAGAMTNLEECQIGHDFNAPTPPTIGVMSGGGLTWISSAALQDNGMFLTMAPVSTLWFITTARKYYTQGFCRTGTYRQAARYGTSYNCSFSPDRWPGPLTLYNCGFDLNVQVKLYGVTGGPGLPPPGAAIYFRPTPGVSQLPDLVFASIPLTGSTTYLTVPTSMPLGLYDMTTTDGIICGITNLPFAYMLPVVESDSTGINVEINCALKP